MAAVVLRAANEGEALLKGLQGRIRDVDSHEMTPAVFWVREFGAVTAPLAEFFLNNPPNAFCGGEAADERAIVSSEVPEYWTTGVEAPSASDMAQRLEFMDMTGIRDTLVFGSGPSLVGLTLISSPPESLEMMFGGKLQFDAMELGRQVIAAHNEWCLRTARVSPRIRPVPIVLTEHSLSAAIAETRRLIDNGMRIISISAANPIEGKAPSHPDNDALWQLCADRNIPVIMHVGGDHVGFLKAGMAWQNSPVMMKRNPVPKEIDGHPYHMSTAGLAASNYMSNLILGGTLERVPHLRIGFAELNAGWVGPTAESLDLWVDILPSRMKGVLSMKPSEYVRRNIRVAPFNFEPVDKYIERYPFLEDVFCFSTDFPHVEGGPDPRPIWIDRLAHLGPEVIEKFFVTNAETLMPG